MVYFESTSISGTKSYSNTMSSKSLTNLPSKNITTRESNSFKDTIDVVKLLELSFFPIPINNKIPHVEVISLILSSLIYAIQCVVVLEEGKYIKVCHVITEESLYWHIQF